MKKKKDTVLQHATIRDVAKLSNTSTATASRVLSNSGYPVSEATARRIKEAAKALNYTPNLAGRLLKSRSTKMLGVVIPNFQNPFFIELIAGIEDAASTRDYMSFVFNSKRSVERERILIQQISRLQIHGLLLSSLDSDSASLDQFLAKGCAAAIFESDFEPSEQNMLINACPHMEENSSLAVESLYNLGHRKIALLTTPLCKKNRRMVCAGYQSALTNHNIQLEDQLILESALEREHDNISYEFQIGMELADRFIKEGAGYTAIVAVNDLVACGVMHRLIDRGIHVPEEVSIIGIDNIPLDLMVNPSLSTIDQDSYTYGYNVCLRLIDYLEDPDSTMDTHYYLPPRLILRSSVKSVSTVKQ